MKKSRNDTQCPLRDTKRKEETLYVIGIEERKRKKKTRIEFCCNLKL